MEQRDAAENAEGDETSREEPDRSGLSFPERQNLRGEANTVDRAGRDGFVRSAQRLKLARRLLRRAWAVADDDVEAQAKTRDADGRDKEG